MHVISSFAMSTMPYAPEDFPGLEPEEMPGEWLLTPRVSEENQNRPTEEAIEEEDENGNAVGLAAGEENQS
jgi:hypothetical protein